MVSVFKWHRFKQDDLGLYLLIEDRVLSSIISHAFPKNGKENGGFLVGKYRRRNIAIIFKEIQPARFNSTPLSYVRYTEGMEYVWDTLYEKDGLIYLGEWHSHPGGSSRYSSTDLRTMIELKYDAQMNIRFPIFLIIGGSKSFHKLSIYTIFQNKIYGFKRY